MLKKLMYLIVVTGMVGLAVSHPAPRKVADETIAQVRTWIQGEDDPVRKIEQRFADFSRQLSSQKSQTDSGVTRLTGEISEIERFESAQARQLDATETLLEEFRFAARDGGYPVVVREAAYTEPELMRQMSLTLSEYTNQRKIVARLKKDRGMAQDRLEDLVKLRSDLEVALITLDAKREMALVDGISLEHETLFAEIESLTERTDQLVEQPVRPVSELLNAESHDNSSELNVSRFIEQGFASLGKENSQ